MAFDRPAREVDRVFLHCSASDHPAHDSVEVMRDWHVNNNGWSDVGYHFFIRKDGTVEPGRDLERTPAAQRGHNRGTIAICLHGLALERFTGAQFEALIGLCDEIDAAYPGEDGVTYHGHTEVSSKSCPVFAYRDVLGLDATGARVRPPQPAPGSTAPPAPRDDLPVLRLTHRGDAVRQLQSLLRAAGHPELALDGDFGQATDAAVRAFQAANGLAVDGIVGPATWRALAEAG